MTIIYIKTNDGETIDRISVEDAAIEDAAQLDYIHAALNDALIVAARKQLRREIAAEKLLNHIYPVIEIPSRSAAESFWQRIDENQRRIESEKD